MKHYVLFSPKVNSGSLDFEDEYIGYLCAKQLLENGERTESDLAEYLSIINPTYKKIDRFEFALLLTALFTKTGKLYSLPYHLARIFYFYDHYQGSDLSLQSDNVISECRKINDYWSVGLDMMQIMKSVLWGNHPIINGQSDCKFVFYFLCLNQSILMAEIDQCLHEIGDEDITKPIDNIVFEIKTLALLKQMGCATLGDLQDVSPYVLIYLLAFEVRDFVIRLQCLKGSLVEEVESFISMTFSSIREPDRSVLDQRYGISTGSTCTLEQIGSLRHLTRERIRQIEARGIKKVSTRVAHNSTLLTLFLKSRLLTFSECAVDIAAVSAPFGDHWREFAFLLQFLPTSSNVRCDEESGLVFDQRLTTIQDTSNKYLSVLGNFLFNEDVEKIKSTLPHVSSFISFLLRIYYKKQDILWVRKGINMTSVILKAIDELFPSGYRISSECDFGKLLNYMDVQYGKEYTSSLNMRGAETALLRSKYGLVDRGTYVNPVFLPTLSNEILESILRFIQDNPPAIYYSSILSKFQKELNACGISNRYILKGVLDLQLGDMFFTKKDYISFEGKASSYESINEYIETHFKNVFSLFELQSHFLGVEEYIFTFFFAAHQQYVLLSGKRAIDSKRIHISDYARNVIVEIYQTLQKSLCTTYVTSSKIYAHLSLFHPDILKEMPFVENQYDLFSVMKNQFPSKFQFKRPFIGTSDIDFSYQEAIRRYAESCRVISKRDIDMFCARMHLRSMYSYLIFIDDVSDLFIQVDKDRLVAKQDDFLDEAKTNEISTILDISFGTNDSINIRDIHNLYMFPKAAYPWNKYHLAGIIRTYLSDRFVLKYTDSQYDKTDFILWRKTNE